MALVGLLAMLLALGVAASSARAESVDGVLDAYAAASADQGTATPGSAETTMQVATPADPSDGVKVGAGASAIRIVPDVDAASGRPIAQPDGSTVYRGDDDDVSTVVEPTANGVQIATVSSNSGDSEAFSYNLDVPDGAHIVANDRGGADVVGADGSSLASVAAPWAQDADGAALRTSYSIDGATLVQHVDTAGAARPIVADPKLEIHWYWFGGVQFWLTRHETEVLYRYREGGAPVAGVAAGACAYLPKPWSWVCGVAVAIVYADFSYNLRQAHERHHCLTVYISGFPSELDFDDGDGKYCEHP